MPPKKPGEQSRAAARRRGAKQSDNLSHPTVERVPRDRRRQRATRSDQLPPKLREKEAAVGTMTNCRRGKRDR